MFVTSTWKCRWGGANFHSTAEIRLKNAKNVVFSILCMPMGGTVPPPQLPPGYATARRVASLLRWQLGRDFAVTPGTGFRGVTLYRLTLPKP